VRKALSVITSVNAATRGEVARDEVEEIQLLELMEDTIRRIEHLHQLQVQLTHLRHNLKIRN